MTYLAFLVTYLLPSRCLSKKADSNTLETAIVLGGHTFTQKQYKRNSQLPMQSLPAAVTCQSNSTAVIMLFYELLIYFNMFVRPIGLSSVTCILFSYFISELITTFVLKRSSHFKQFISRPSGCTSNNLCVYASLSLDWNVCYSLKVEGLNVGPKQKAS